MARNVFFSFDYDDIMAVNVVRMSDVVLPANRNLPFHDRSLYEEARKTPGAIKAAIDNSIKDTSVTVVLVGGQTWRSGWVRYEIAKSLERGNGFVVVDISGVGPEPTPTQGHNPLDSMMLVPWYASDGFNILEWTGSQFSEFALLPSASNRMAEYPRELVSGDAYQLSQRFTIREHWSLAQMYFPSILQRSAEVAGRPRQ